MPNVKEVCRNNRWLELSRSVRSTRSRRRNYRLGRRTNRLNPETLEHRYMMTAVAEIGSNDFRISEVGGLGSTEAIALAPAIAYNAIDNEYLVVYESVNARNPNDSGSTREVFGQVIDGETGRQKSHPLVISTSFSENDRSLNARAPTVAWSSNSNSYFVAWVADNTLAEGQDVYGQLLDSNGIEFGIDDFRISNVATQSDTAVDRPSVTYNPLQDDFLVTWTAEGKVDAGLVAGEAEIFGRLVDGNGSPKGIGEFRVSDVRGLGNSSGSVADVYATTNTKTGEYLIVWHANDTDDAQNLAGRPAVFGQFLDKDGIEIGANDFILSEPSSASGQEFRLPIATYNPQDETYLVSYSRKDDPAADHVSLIGAIVDAASKKVESDFLINKVPTENRSMFHAHAYSSTSNEYLITWATSKQDDGRDVFAQRIRADGTAIDLNDFRVSDVGGRQAVAANAMSARAAFNPANDEYMVVWSADDTDSPGVIDNESEIFGQRLGTPEPSPPPIPIDFSSTFNIDAIVDLKNGTRDRSQDSIVNDLTFITESAAATFSSTAIGLPDDRQIESSEFGPHVQLFSDSRAGLNAISMKHVGESAAVQTPLSNFEQLHVFATAVGGKAITKVKVTYSDKSHDVFTLIVPDLQEDITDSNDRFTVLKRLDLAAIDATRLANDFDASLFGFNLNTHKELLITDISIRKAGGDGNLVVMGASGTGVDHRIVVTNSDDEFDGDLTPNDISLREAIDVANRAPIAQTIMFDSSLHGSKINLNLGELLIASAGNHRSRAGRTTEIRGPGADLLTIDGLGQNKILMIDKVDNDEVTLISGLTLTGGKSPSSGGAIFNRGNLQLDSVTIKNSTAVFGAAIHNELGSRLSLSNSELSNNSAQIGGGAIHGGIGSRTVVVNSTLSRNSAAVNGGAILVDASAALTVAASTITNNRADADGDGRGGGGGIHVNGTPVELVSSIVAGNFQGTPSNDVADDLQGVNGNDARVDTDSRFNLIGTATGVAGLRGTSHNNQFGTDAEPLDPRLGPLANNGGPTRSHLPRSDSPVTDKGSIAFSLGRLRVDQRGALFPRVADGDNDGNPLPDIGAVELLHSDSARIPGDSNGDGLFDTADLVLAFQANEFEDGIDGNSTFEEGDWDGDGDFRTSDLILAFQAGHFEKG